MVNADHSEVDIVIPTRGRGALVDATIESIRRSTGAKIQLWVVDQSDDSATEETVALHALVDARVHYVRSMTRGSNFARDEGVASGRAPYILFTDDDCRVEPDWAAHMTSELATPEHSAVFGRVLPDTSDCAPTSEEARAVSPSIRLAVKNHPLRQEFAGDRLRLDFGHGANMGIRRDVYETIGGFDRMLGVGGPLKAWPERDLGYRILARGGRIIYTPRALVHHRHWRAWKEVRATCANYGFGAGAVAGKYLRTGDWGGGYLLFEWLIDQGARQVASGVLKWRSRQKIEIGLLNMVYPWVGLARSLRYPIDREHVIYLEPRSAAAATKTPEIGAGDAVGHFSESARQFHGHYREREEFIERLALWHDLLDRHAPPGGKCLDMGCGSGVFSLYLAGKGAEVIGVDGAPEMIELCNEQRRENGLDNVRFLEGRLPNVSAHEAELADADLVISSSVLEYVEDLDGALALFARLLRPGATLVLSMPNLYSLSRVYERLNHRLSGRSDIYSYIRHFTTPQKLAQRLKHHGLTLTEAHHYDHHTRVAKLTRKLRLPAALTESLFVAVFRKDGAGATQEESAVPASMFRPTAAARATSLASGMD